MGGWVSTGGVGGIPNHFSDTLTGCSLDGAGFYPPWGLLEETVVPRGALPPG